MGKLEEPDKARAECGPGRGKADGKKWKEEEVGKTTRVS